MKENTVSKNGTASFHLYGSLKMTDVQTWRTDPRAPGGRRGEGMRRPHPRGGGGHGSPFRGRCWIVAAMLKGTCMFDKTAHA